jgi:cleavage stimulation factor subunit 3
MTKIVRFYTIFRLRSLTSQLLDARALFERVIATFAPERARPLWERWARYEYQYGDLEAALTLEKRISEVYPSGISLTPFYQSLC